MSKWLFTLQRVRWHPEDSQTVPAWPKHRTLWKSAAGNGPKTLDAIFQVLFVCLLGLTSTLLQLQLVQLTAWSSRPFSGSADLLSGAVPDSTSVLGLCDIKGFHLQWSGVLDSKNSTSSHSLTPPSVLPAVSSQPQTSLPAYNCSLHSILPSWLGFNFSFGPLLALFWFLYPKDNFLVARVFAAIQSWDMSCLWHCPRQPPW